VRKDFNPVQSRKTAQNAKAPQKSDEQKGYCYPSVSIRLRTVLGSFSTPIKVLLRLRDLKSFWFAIQLYLVSFF